MTTTTTIFIFVLLLALAIVAFAVVINGALKQLKDTTLALAKRLDTPPVIADGKTKENTDALRLQACERLTLMLERINVPNLLLRLPAPVNSSAKEYTATLLLTIREEFEYNVTQQIYVSEALWSILLQARDNVSQLIVRAAEGAETGEQVAGRLRLMSSRQPEDPVGLAQMAVRKEATQVLG
ncbi:MAG: hypothetical protein AAGA62_02080 [Bacteroidota bacterium]